MQRTKLNRIPSAILTSDWHIREDTPTCYIDNEKRGSFFNDQWNAMTCISQLQKKYNCIVIHPGDLFDHWKPSPELLALTLLALPKRFYTVYGQHDLPQHNLKLKRKTGIRVLEAAGALKVLPNANYGQKPDEYCKYSFDPYHTTLVWHHMTYITPPYPGATGGNAKGILRKYPQYDLIVTGDNHEPFYVEYQGRLLVNPGPITRQTAKQINFKPRVYLWYSDTNTVEEHYLPFTEGLISREHIDKVKERDNRIEAFISHLNNKWEAESSFEENLEKFKHTNPVRKQVMDIIYKSIEK